MEILKVQKLDSNLLPTIEEVEFPAYIYSEELPENTSLSQVLVEIFRQGIQQ